MAIQEAIPIEPNVDLSRLFSSEILDRLPTSGSGRIRRTMVILVGEEPISLPSPISTKEHVPRYR